MEIPREYVAEIAEESVAMEEQEEFLKSEIESGRKGGARSIEDRAAFWILIAPIHRSLNSHPIGGSCNRGCRRPLQGYRLNQNSGMFSRKITCRRGGW